MNFKSSVLGAVVCLISCSRCFAADAAINGDKTYVTAEFLKLGRVAVTIFTRAVSARYIYRKQFAWGGDEAQPPKVIIKAIEVRRDEAFFVPLSAYVDLGNPSHITLVASGTDGFEVKIVGGDAAGSYTATLYFKNGEIIRRRVASAEFPKEVWEQTKYSFNHLNN